ncbi:HAD family hydrolase [Paraglaciecola arctica]|nr:HAD-IA family hydrolase [Paraglaciecola arctica]
MIKHYLFDWGDTLMVDLPNQTGPMCDWPKIQVVAGAKNCLKRLSRNAQCHLATNAEDSSEVQIRHALIRAGLSEFITQVFCRENLGLSKTDTGYYLKIVQQLGASPSQVSMLGDSLEKDVLAPMAAGLKSVWFNPTNQKSSQNILMVEQLSEFV